MGSQRIAERGVLDARPLRSVSAETPWDEARKARDRLLDTVNRTLADEGVEALVMRSQAGNYPAWLRLEAWLPVGAGDSGGACEQSELEMIVEAKPLRLHPVTYTVRAQRGKTAISISGRRRLADPDVAEWVRFVIGRGPHPRSYTPVRDNVLRAVSWIVPAAAPEHNPMAAAVRTSLLDVPTIAAVLLCAVLGFSLYLPALAGLVIPTIGGLALAAGLAAPVLFTRVERRDWVTAEPRDGPRHLRHIDSWHAVLAGAAGGEAQLKQRLMTRLGGSAEAGLTYKLERYGHRTPNGYEERERLTVTHCQGEVQLHIQPFGEDLFVGWQAFLNWAQWAETQPKARKAVGRRDIAFRELTPSWYFPTQFDLIDLDSLSALVQRIVEAEVRALLTEARLDQEIDFEVMRADRGNALDQRSVWPERAQERARNSWRFLGTGPVRRTSVGEMKLAAVEGSVAERHGLAFWPAVLLLPLVTALAYWGLSSSGQMTALRFQRLIAPDFTYSFIPLFHLPIALAVGLGVHYYAKARLLHALLAALLVAALTFAMHYVYNIALAQVVTQRAITTNEMIYYWVLAGSFLLSGIACLMAATAFAPQLREPRLWIWSLLLWTVWGVGTLWLVRSQRLTGNTSSAVIWSTRVLMAATIGWALTREAGGGIVASIKASLARSRQAAADAAATATVKAQAAAARSLEAVKGGWLDLRGAHPGVLLVALAVAALVGLERVSIGTSSRVGPGMVPLVLSLLLLAFGLIALILPWRRRPIGAAGMRSILATLAAGIVFIVGLPLLGGLTSAAIAGAVAAQASERAEPMDMGFGALSGALVVILAVSLLKLPVELWPISGRL